ncbi:uncharacterized protein BT62DRAFT_924104 [Guyanagaster necrorhizus]|uniref:Uncharacterized protein n=1 Tax=Guyanagaster necrorhizus TaxID=856835 RepID=A0A9P8AM52_9AGAR|nr:uncharacterized protein BT62DRAFT_924104 [Guyanagaster necrorhizus MCA 3950]KAG7440316.1 hypothetical protein BT62DRAFT_924104 [Guyanagaster necrorhizus MCA 3950]
MNNSSRLIPSTAMLKPLPGPSDECTPLVPRATRGKPLATLKVLASIFVVAFLAFHLVGDYTNTDHTDVQDRIRRREDMERAKRIEGEELRRKLAHQQEDKKRRLAYEEEDKRREVEREREERTIQARLVAVARMRIYHAELLNVPASEDAHGWCMKTSIDIHGITYDHPELCTLELIDGAVKTIGYWTVSSNEPTCKTWWGDHEKKMSDCFGSHKRRVDAKLFNHQEPWDNWAEMCFSTPSEFAWQRFDHPDTCENKGRDGIVGSWFIEADESECP